MASVFPFNMKDTIDFIAAPLTHICNLSFFQGFFLYNLKTAKMLLIFKTDHSSSFSNYRPISILLPFQGLQKTFFLHIVLISLKI